MKTHCKRGHLRTPNNIRKGNNACRVCDNLRKRIAYKTNKRQFRDKNYRNTLKRLYGLTIERFEALLRNQLYRCAICRNEFVNTPCVDHIKGTKIVRGLLCKPCNTGIGLLRHRIQNMKNAAIYLELNETRGEVVA